MDKSFLEKYALRPEDAPDDGRAEDADPVVDLGPFGWLRNSRGRCPMLELRRRTGNILVVAYAWIDHIDYDPSVGISLSHMGRKLLITGRNLNTELRPNVRLFQGLTRPRVPWIREASLGETMRISEGSCLVESIDWNGTVPK